MDSKYKLLTRVDPTKIPVTINKKFSKLALGRRLESDQETPMANPTQRILFPDDEETEKDESLLLTDDESEDEIVPGSETHCSDLDTQMSKLGIVSPPKRDSVNSVVRSVEKIKKNLRDLGIPSQEPINTQNMPSLKITEDLCLSQELRNQMKEDSEEENSHVSILTISSTDNAEECPMGEISQEDITPEVIVLDESTDNELPLRGSFPPVSESTQKDSLSGTVEQKLNAFFDKIPTFNESLTPHYSTNKLVVKSTDETVAKTPAVEDKSPVSLDETNAEVKNESDSGIVRGKETTEFEEKTQVVNISAKIKINIQVEEHEVTSSSEESDGDDSEDDEIENARQVKEEPRRQHDEKPPQEEYEIDKDAESILTEMYGEAWKTKEVLDSVKKKKNPDKNRTNYSMFFKNLGTDLESTRFQADEKGDHRTRPTQALPKSSSKETPRKEKISKEEPRYKNICDTDTESEPEYPGSDSEKSWNYSENSSTDSSSDEMSIRKKGARKKSKKKNLDFTQNASSDSDNTIFEIRPSTRFQNPDVVTPKDKIFNIDERPKPSTRRKLFSRKLYDMENEAPSNDDEDERRPIFKEKDALKEIVSPLPTHLLPVMTPKPMNKKLESVKKGIRTPSKSVKKETTAGETASPFFSQKDQKKCYGFLISLNPSTPKNLAHPDAVHYRDNYRVAKGELTTVLYDMYNEKIFDNRLKVTIKWNKKLLTTAGRCTNMSRTGIRLAEIDLSEKVLTSADRVRCTLIHELCHAAAWILDGEKKGHADNWRKWATRANKVFPELPKITVCHHYNIEYKYTYQCVGCGAKTQMHSKTKKVENIQCKYCKGAIQVFLNKKNKDGQIVQTPVREASGFAKFVQEKYKIFKTPNTTHAETMKILSQEFTKINLEKN